ncbi:MAG: histidine phosphatase family protein, partial [Fibrobacter sp.]|nr:histidine phosphatase family protein [Fibrobacter sp.]
IIAGCGDDSSNSTPTSTDVPEQGTPTDPSTTTDPATNPTTDPSTDPATNPTTDPSTEPVTNPENPTKDSTVADTTVKDPVVNPDTSTTPGEPATKVSVNRDPAVANLAVVPDSNGFYDVGDIYKAVPAESKIVFVLRHAERESGLGTESPLTEVGVQQALDVGAKLASDESFYFASTDFLRTRTTAEKIAEGHGQLAAVVEARDDIIYGSYFLTVPSDTLDALVSKRGGSFRYVSQWAYDQPFTNNYAIQHGVATYFYDLFERGDQFINEVVLANLPSWKRVNVLITHDLLTEPLAVYASNRTVDLKTYESFRWINYVAGIAVVVDASGLVTVLPAKGVDLGFLNTKEAYGDK